MADSEAAANAGENYDVIVLGGGKGGKSLAMKLGSAGRRVALIEKSRSMIGGSCINVACIPTKTFITSARHLINCQKAFEYGISGVERSKVKVDWSRVRARVTSVVTSMREMNLQKFESTPNLDLVIGEGKFCAPKCLEVKLEDGTVSRYSAPVIVINTGTRPQLPDTPGLNELAHTSQTIQQLDALPEHLIVMGAGYIGIEFAQLFSIFGSKVTLIDRGEQILSREDSDVAQALTQVLTERGVRILSKTKVEKVEKSAESAESSESGRSYSDGIVLTINDGKDAGRLEGSHLLVALGRVPNTEGLDLGLSGVFIDKRGFVKVDEKLQSSCEGIYAVGDVNGGPQFTHISFDDYRIVREQLLGSGQRSTKDRQVPSTLFTEPELARVGITEKEAVEQKLDVEMVKVPLSVVPRARVSGETTGFMKAIIDRSTKRILGCTIFGADAGNLLAVVQMAMLGDLPFDKVRDAIFSHPTMPEGLNDLFTAAKVTGE